MDFTPLEKETFALKADDVLLNEGQSIELVGRSAIYRGSDKVYCFQNTLIRYRAYQHTLSTYAQTNFKWWLDTGRFRDVASQTTSVAHLGADRFARMLFPLPQIGAQDIRFDFMLAFKKLTTCLNLVFPARQALDFMPDYNALAEINVLAGKHFRDARLSMKGIPPKLRTITDAYLESKGIEVKITPISILDQDFEKQVGNRKRTKTKAAEVEHAIRHHLDVELDDDPDLKASFAEALAKIFEEFRDNWKKIYEELEKLRQRIISAQKEPTYGLHRKKQMPFFRMFEREIFGDESIAGAIPELQAKRNADFYGMTSEDRISKLVDLTQKIYLAVERELRLTGFWESIPARNKLKAELQNTLLAYEFVQIPGIVPKRAQIISRIMEIAEKNNDTILFAE